MASTAVSIEAYAVMTTTFIQGDPESSAGIRSRPLAVPRRKSTNAMWKERRDASATASWKLPTAGTWWPSASRQMARVFRMLLSSSTTRTLMGAPVGVGVVMVPLLAVPGSLSPIGRFPGCAISDTTAEELRVLDRDPGGASRTGTVVPIGQGVVRER